MGWACVAQSALPPRTLSSGLGARNLTAGAQWVKGNSGALLFRSHVTAALASSSLPLSRDIKVPGSSCLPRTYRNQAHRSCIRRHWHDRKIATQLIGICDIHIDAACLHLTKKERTAICCGMASKWGILVAGPMTIPAQLLRSVSDINHIIGSVQTFCEVCACLLVWLMDLLMYL